MEEKKEVNAEVKTEEVKPPEDKLTAIEKQLAEFSQRLNQQQSVITKKDVENKRLREQLEDRSEETALTKAMIAALSLQTGQSTEEVETAVKQKQPDLIKQYDEILTKSKTQRQQEEMARNIRELEKSVSQLGYKRGDPEYYEIFGRAADNDFDGAYARIGELAAKKQPPKVEEKKEEKVDVEEIARKYMEEHGLLKTETATPSGSGSKIWTREEVQNMPPKEYRKNFPDAESFYKAIEEGRVK